MRPRVAIVLVTYYGDDNLDRLWPSVAGLRYPSDRYWLVVVDNDPARGARRWFRARAPQVQVLAPEGNLGYAGGGALGMDAALAAGADYVAMLTQDTELNPGWLEALVEVAEAHPEAGAVQPKILRRLNDGRTVIHTWGNEVHFLGVAYVGGDGLPDRPLAVRQITSASGAGVLYRASALRQVGRLDPRLFMYHEDIDVSWRLRLAGWQTLLAPEAVMYHHYEFARSPDKFYFLERNRLINLLTHYRLRTLLLLAPALALFEALVLAYAVTQGWAGRRLAVCAYFARPSSWAYLRRKRAWVQGLRRVPDRVIAERLVGRIDAAWVASGPLRYVINPLLELYWRGVRRLIVW